MNQLNEKDRRFFKVTQIVTLVLIVAIAIGLAYITNAQSNRLAERATNIGVENRHALGALINWVTCQAAIPLNERTPERMDVCFDILRAEGIPISVPDIKDNTPTPTPQPGPAPSPTPAPTETQTGVAPSPSPAVNESPPPSPPAGDRDGWDARSRPREWDCPGNSGGPGHGCQQGQGHR